MRILVSLFVILASTAFLTQAEENSSSVEPETTSGYLSRAFSDDEIDRFFTQEAINSNFLEHFLLDMYAASFCQTKNGKCARLDFISPKEKYNYYISKINLPSDLSKSEEQFETIEKVIQVIFDKVSLSRPSKGIVFTQVQNVSSADFGFVVDFMDINSAGAKPHFYGCQNISHKEKQTYYISVFNTLKLGDLTCIDKYIKRIINFPFYKDHLVQYPIEDHKILTEIMNLFNHYLKIRRGFPKKTSLLRGEIHSFVSEEFSQLLRK